VGQPQLSWELKGGPAPEGVRNVLRRIPFYYQDNFSPN
jgi:hypothetical protein